MSVPPRCPPVRARRLRAGTRSVLGAALTGLLLSLPACSGALYSQFRHRGGAMAGGESTAAQAGAPYGKAEVLARLGAPADVLPLVNGDIFVYRASAADVDVLNLNTGVLTGVFVPLYARWDGTYGEHVLFVEFDVQGRVRALTAGRSPR